MSTESLLRTLGVDLETLGDRFRDDEFSAELYRALTRTQLTKEGHEGHVAFSFVLAEGMVNLTRQIFEQSPLELAQSGGEGEVSDTVRDELARLGWTIRPLNTGEHDPAHRDHDHVAVRKDHPARR
jgi:hypothetical protein